MLAFRAVCFWPGLPSAWLLGLARGLVVAVVFSWCMCGLLLATFVWPAWISVGLLRLLWIAAVCTWFVTSARNLLCLPSMLATSSSSGAEMFVSAQAEYLAGNFFEAEAILLEVLHKHPRDAEALLLLACVLRRTKRWQAALRRLGQLDLIDAAAPWQFEIKREKSLIERDMSDTKESDEPLQATWQSDTGDNALQSNSVPPI